MTAEALLQELEALDNHWETHFEMCDAARLANHPRLVFFGGTVTLISTYWEEGRGRLLSGGLTKSISQRPTDLAKVRS